MGAVLSRKWSPFSTVEKRNIKAGGHVTLMRGFVLKVIGIMGVEDSHSFMCSGDEHGEERNEWVRVVLKGICEVMASWFPASRPLVDRSRDPTRKFRLLMAGYLLWSQGCSCTSLQYCELRMCSSSEAAFVFRNAGGGEGETSLVNLTHRTPIRAYKGIRGCLLGIDLMLLCAPTHEERELWLRALSSMQAEMMFAIPTTTWEDTLGMQWPPQSSFRSQLPVFPGGDDDVPGSDDEAVVGLLETLEKSSNSG